ncbi:MAG: OsmC family protein [Ilumatobacteraceae bacterium]
MHDHEYRTQLAWVGSTGIGYKAYGREHHVSAPGTPSLALTSDPSFGGDAAVLNPEQLLVMAASSCQLLSFLAVCARAKVDVVRYDDDAHGLMPAVSSPMRLTAITLRPRITVSGDVSAARVAELVDEAHHGCFIANSLTTEVVVVPEIEVVAG